MDYTIFCILPDDRPTFLVDIPETRLVEHLKDAIKSKIPLTLKDIEAHDLTLYQINLDESDEAEYKRRAKILAKDLNSLVKLGSSMKLKTVFGSSGPLEGKIHILVMLPSGEPISSRACR